MVWSKNITKSDILPAGIDTFHDILENAFVNTVETDDNVSDAAGLALKQLGEE